MRHLQLENHDRNDNSDDTIAECLQSSFRHVDFFLDLVLWNGTSSVVVFLRFTCRKPRTNLKEPGVLYFSA